MTSLDQTLDGFVLKVFKIENGSPSYAQTIFVTETSESQARENAQRAFPEGQYEFTCSPARQLGAGVYSLGLHR